MDIKLVLSKMTLEEKIQLLTYDNLLDTKGFEEFGIPSIEMADGPSGIHSLHGKDKEIEGGAVMFPTPAVVAASWDRELAWREGEALARECNFQGVDLALAPGVNIKRSPLCGRNFEYYSEDPVLSGEMGAAVINGIQSKGVGTCLKHFTANNQETDRTAISSEIDERTLREIYLKPFEIAIEKSNPVSIMAAYNRLNGVYCSQNKWLLNKVLREDWGYEGAVISDWGAVHDEAASFAAGLDMKMPKDADLCEKLKKAVEEGSLSEAQIDRAAENMIKLALKVSSGEKENYDRAKQHRIAQEIVEESIILMKNEENILPINREKVKKLVVLGYLAETPTVMGGGSSGMYNTERSVIEAPLDFIKELAGDDMEVIYHPVYGSAWTSSYNDRAKKTCDGADMAIIFIGDEHFGVETECFDRYGIYYNPAIDWMIKGACRTCDNIVLVTQNSCVTVPKNLPDKVKAIVHMGLSGEGGGSAIAKVLFGNVNPSGKTTETFMNKLTDRLDFPGDGKKVIYDERWAVGYRYYDSHPDEVWYPFGHGLSYTNFEYSDISVVKGDDQTVEVEFKLKNVGKVFGKEVVQLYVGKPESFVSRPIKELKNFDKIALQPNEEKTVKLILDKHDFEYYNICNDGWTLEEGEYNIMIGASAADIKLTASIEL
ncbi:MAG: glycosyl hydrolase [Ruminococcaceae bacterium]|nr:glycosyl hydrolase [Oscillospiraceae bacterium]